LKSEPFHVKGRKMVPEFTSQARPLPSIRLLKQAAATLLEGGVTHREAALMLRMALLQEALRRTGGNISHAANLLHLHRNRFAQNLAELNLRDLPRQIRGTNRVGQHTVRPKMRFGQQTPTV
jgi:DNA-binding NtrC family response regulator